MKRLQSIFVAGVLLSLVAACQSLGLQKPQTFNEKAAVAYSSVAEIAKTTNTLAKAGKISKEDALSVYSRASEALSAVEAAELIAGAKPVDATTKVDAALAIIATLEVYLQSKGAK